MTEVIRLIDYLPKEIISVESKNVFKLKVAERDNHLFLTYKTFNNRKYSGIIPKYIKRDIKSLEVLGLLQAEMTKVNNGSIQFSNHEFEIINGVLSWFDENDIIQRADWRWYVKLNMSKPHSLKEDSFIKTKLTNYWLDKCRLNLDKKYAVGVSYSPRKSRKFPLKTKYGSLIIEYKNLILGQIIKHLVAQITSNISSFSKKEILFYMRGILAGESNVEINRKRQIYRIGLCAQKESERLLFKNCLDELGIDSKIYANYASIIISKKENLKKVFELKLMCRSRIKYATFLKLLKSYKIQ